MPTRRTEAARCTDCFNFSASGIHGRNLPRKPGSRESARIIAGREQMKATLNVVGVILVLFGAIWFLQGINVLPGSFMTGQIRWAVYGALAIAAGISLIVTAKRQR